MDVVAEVEAAEARIRPYVRTTRLLASPVFDAETGARVYFKCENLQETGSFKARGALNKVLSLSDEVRERGVVTASTGNHGTGVAWALAQVGARGTVYCSPASSASKIDAMRRLGIEVCLHGDDPIEAERHARDVARERGQAFVSPYNDPQVGGGQGTIAVELCRQLEHIDAIFVALGGGGLISGIGGYLKSRHPDVEVVACSAQNSQVMAESVRAGKVLDLPSLPTLSDGTAGGVEAGTITFELCRRYVDRFVAVDEDAIAASLRDFIDAHHQLIEGAAAVPLAALRADAERYAGKNVVVVLCGANIGSETLAAALRGETAAP